MTVSAPPGSLRPNCLCQPADQHRNAPIPCAPQVQSHPLANLTNTERAGHSQTPRKKKAKDGRRRGDEIEQQQQGCVERAVESVKQHPATSAAVGAVAFYTALRAGIEVRRRRG